MEDKLLKTVSDELCKHFNDPIDIECSYCNAAKAVIPLVRADMQREMRACFLKYLTVDSDTRDRRRKDYNQAIFDDEKGYAVFSGTDLDMVMEKFDMALKGGE